MLPTSIRSNSCKGTISMIIYLYVKTHSITGLKYLGKTIQNPYTYSGSGTDWKLHLKEYGPDHVTEVLRECKTKEELNEWGRYYSQLWSVVTSKEWANRIPETGGGWCGQESRKKISKTLTGFKRPPRSEEHKKHLSESTRGISKPRSKQHQDAWTVSSKLNWTNNTERKKQVSELGKSNKGRKHTLETLEKKRQAMLEYWRLKRTQVS